MKILQKYKKWLIVISSIVITLPVLIIVAIYIILFYQVKITCDFAQSKYQGKCVESLAKVAVSEKYSYRERNDAVWALGQMADKRSLPILKQLYTGDIPSREPLDKTLSQYELRKAIRWCEEGNWTSWMYPLFR